MTPEINEIDKQIAALSEERSALAQAHLSTLAVAQVGELITWGKQGKKGRVESFKVFCGEVGYRVTTIKKDGSEGIRTTVEGYDKPVRVAA